MIGQKHLQTMDKCEWPAGKTLRLTENNMTQEIETK